MNTSLSPYFDTEPLELEGLDDEIEGSTKQLDSPFLTHDFSVEDDLNVLEHFDEDWSEDELDDEWDKIAEIENLEDDDEFYEEEESPFEEISIGQQPDVVNFIPDIAAIMRNWVEKAKKNVIYSKRLGWAKDSDQISQLLLKSTGQSNIDHTSVPFAMLVAQWQAQNGFKGKDVDGIIGPNTWEKMEPQLGASLPAAKPSKPTIYEIYEILAKKILRSNHKFKVRLMDMLNRLRKGGESGDDRVIQWRYIFPAKSRYGPVGDLIQMGIPNGMPLRQEHNLLGVDDKWIEKNLKSRSDVERPENMIRSFPPFKQFVTSIRWELNAVSWGKEPTTGENISREHYEDKLWSTFTNIHEDSAATYLWLNSWGNDTMLWSDSTMGVGYKAIHEWLQAQAHKKTSPIYSIRTIKGSWWDQETTMGQSSEVIEEEQSLDDFYLHENPESDADDFGTSYESSESNYKDENNESEESNYQDEYIPDDNGAEEEVLYNEVIDDNVLDDFLDLDYDEEMMDEDMEFMFSKENSLVESFIPASNLSWKGASHEQLQFMKKVYNAHVARASKKRKFTPSLPNGQRGRIENTWLQKDAAIALNDLLQKVRQEIDELNKNVTIRIASGYRSADRQFELWPQRFRTYYNRTRPYRSKLGEEHGIKAINYMVRYIGARFAAPGYSLHQTGIAVDLQPTENGIVFRNKTRKPYPEKWRKSWFWSWLINNAATYGFYQNTDINEPWHWQYNAKSIVNSPNPYPSKHTKSNGSWGDIIAKGKNVIGGIYNSGKLINVAMTAISNGEKDENKVTNVVFYSKHPTRFGKKLKPNDPLTKDWLSIRRNIVRPLLRDTNKNGTYSPTTSSAQTNSSSSTNKNVRIYKGSGWGGWKGNGSKGTIKIPSDWIKDKFDVAVAVASVPEGGSFDNVNMYDKGILSWGIKQWTIHAGSLQGLLSYIQQGLEQKGKSSLWDQLFPGLSLNNRILIYRGQAYPITNSSDLIRLFRGSANPTSVNDKSIDPWIIMFAIAGRHPLIQKFQFEYAKKELREKLMQKNLGKTLKNRSNSCNPKKSSWCRDLKSFGSSFKPENYGTIGKYIEGNMKAMALFNGMATQNPMWTYIYLKRAIDVLIARQNTANIDSWSGDWQNELSIVLENLFTKSGVATWGTAGVKNYARKHPKKELRQSRTSKLLAAYSEFSSHVRE